MSLNSTALGTTLSNAMGNANNAADAHTNFANALKGYVLANIELHGTYTGNTPVPAPDPLSGPYTWKPVSFNISASAIQAGASSGLSGWTSAIKTECMKITFSGGDTSGQVSIGSVTLTLSSLSIDMNAKPNERGNAHKNAAEGIVAALQSAIANPVSIPGVSVTPGTGTVVFNSVN